MSLKSRAKKKPFLSNTVSSRSCTQFHEEKAMSGDHCRILFASESDSCFQVYYAQTILNAASARMLRVA